jgi:hypothetical protein
VPPPRLSLRLLKHARFLRIVGVEAYRGRVRKKGCLGGEQKGNRLLREQQLSTDRHNYNLDFSVVLPLGPLSPLWERVRVRGLWAVLLPTTPSSWPSPTRGEGTRTAGVRNWRRIYSAPY